MDARGVRRVVVPLAVALLVLLATAASVAVDRLRRTPFAVEAIDVPYTMLRVLPETSPVPVRPAPPVAAAPALRSVSGCPTPPVVPVDPATAAVAAGPRLVVYDRPDGRPTRTLTNPTREGQRLRALVVETRGTWLRVQLPVRPNGTTGWVREADVTTFVAPYRILVELCAHRLTVFRGGQVVWERPVAVGKPSTPTPRGAFYVDFVATMRATGAYGPYLLSVAGFSDVLHQYGNGGIGQIALHGTNRPALIGTSASHGCVRLRNADVTALAKLVPPGTPVTITT